MSDPKRYELYVDASLQAEEGGEWVKYDDYADLKAQVERLTKAGDVMIEEWWLQLSCPQRMKASWMKEQAIADWNAAKEGKPHA